MKCFLISVVFAFALLSSEAQLSAPDIVYTKLGPLTIQPVQHDESRMRPCTVWNTNTMDQAQRVKRRAAVDKLWFFHYIYPQIRNAIVFTT